MSAYDRAIEREDMDCQQSTTTPLQNISTVPSCAPRSYSSGVSLITFIEELFTEDNAHQILQSLQTISNPKQRSKMLSNMQRFDSLIL